MSFWKGLVWSREHIGLFFAPLAFTALLSLMVTLLWHDDIPHGLDAHDWANFTRKIEYALHGEDTTRGMMLFLLFLHALQTLVCFPLLHITKIMYGYLMGVWAGCLVATVWEMALVAGFVLLCGRLQPGPPTPPLRKLLDHADARRGSKKFCVFVMSIQLASVPLVTATALVLYRVLTPAEFLVSHLIVTFVMSLKDTWLGDFVAHSHGQTLDIAVVAGLFFVSTILPMLVTVCLLGQVSKTVLNMAEEEVMLGGADAEMKNAAGGVATETIVESPSWASSEPTEDSVEELDHCMQNLMESNTASKI